MKISDGVTLVIPGRNCAKTIVPCLRAVTPLVDAGLLAEIIFVDDHSTDDTRALVAQFPVTLVDGNGRGPGAARNIGWQAAQTPLVWFIDSDCVAEPFALEILHERIDDTDLAGVGGSYGNMLPNELLACLIHEEIVERHRLMPLEVDFLATFNVLYRRDILEKVGGFDERYLKAQDAELAFRIGEAGGRLGFEADSRVRHFHPHRLIPYLTTQFHQGFWRASLYRDFPNRIGGDSYSGLSDHLQPPLALLSLALIPACYWALGALAELTCLLALACTQIQKTRRIVRKTRSAEYLLFGVMSFLRSYPRAVGFSFGVLSAFRDRHTPSDAARITRAS